MAYVSALELGTYLRGVVDLDELDAEWIAQAELLLDMISADVEEAAGVPIESGSGTVLLPGSWSRDLILPAGPIRSISSVSINGNALGSGEYLWNERSLIRRASGDVASLSEEDLSVEWSMFGLGGATWRAGHHWGGPASTIRLNYSWGFDDVPGVVKALTLRIAARTIGNVSDVTQESLASYSVTYSSSARFSGSHVSDGERRRLRRMFGSSGGTITVGGR